MQGKGTAEARGTMSRPQVRLNPVDFDEVRHMRRSA